MAGFVDAAAGALGGVDLLVNNVGVFRPFALEELSEEALDEAFDVNVKAAVMAARASAPHMRRRGGGAIVNVCGGRTSPYCTSRPPSSWLREIPEDPGERSGAGVLARRGRRGAPAAVPQSRSVRTTRRWK
jgi:hypothetical protein